MKNGVLAFIFFALQSLAYSQTKDSTKPFIANMRIDWTGGDISTEEFFSVLIPANFDYDSATGNASGYFKRFFYQIHAEVRFDYGDFLKKVMKDGKYDLVKYARLMTREHFSSYDTCIISGVRSENVRTINGVSVLKINYASKETIMGYKSSKKNILYLIPMYPKEPNSFDIKYQMMIFLFVSCFRDIDDRSLNLFAEQIISTLKPL